MAFQRDCAVGTDANLHRVLVAIRDERDLCPLLRLACALARARGGGVRLFTVTRDGMPPSWLKLPDDCRDVPVDVVVRAGKNVGTVILRELQQLEPDALILGWSGHLNRGRYLLGRTLDPVIQAAPCDVIVLRGECVERMQRILVPVAGDPNAPHAFDIARALAPEAEVTALYVAPERLGPAEVLLGQDVLTALVRDLRDPSHVHPCVVQAAGPVEGILGEVVQGYDLLILGASGANIVSRFLFGDIPQAVMVNSPVPVMAVRYRLTYLRSFVQRIWMRIFGLVPRLTVQERARVYKTLRRGSQPSADFFVFITLASAIASLGLLLNSPAVVIGAMLVAPLMSAILGMGLSLVKGDQRFFWRALSTTARGMFLAVFTGFVMGLVVPGASLTQEILGHANPTLLDLGVALVAGAAAAYAISRPDASAALAGVAIAAALAPPLTTVGIGLVLRRWWIAGGALLLFLTNMVSIVAAGGLTFFLLGFRPELDQPDRNVILRRGTRSVAVLLLLVTIPLAVLTSQSLRELRLRQAIESALYAELAQMPRAELVHWEVAGEFDDDTLHLDVTIRVPQTMTYQDARALQEMVGRRLSRPVALSLSVVPTTWLRAYVPPTPTPTGVPTPTPMPVPTETLTPTPTPVPTSTPTSTPNPTPTPTPWVLAVTRVGAMGLGVRYSPGGVVVGYLQEGTSVVVTDGPVTLRDRVWYRVFSAADQMEGWVAGDCLAPAAIP
jgi:uncharacterized hydrophobic protein (TIGR00271 family)